MRNNEYSTLVADAPEHFQSNGGSFLLLRYGGYLIRLLVCCVILENITGVVLLSQQGHIVYVSTLILWLLL